MRQRTRVRRDILRDYRDLLHRTPKDEHSAFIYKKQLRLRLQTARRNQLRFLYHLIQHPLHFSFVGSDIIRHPIRSRAASTLRMLSFLPTTYCMFSRWHYYPQITNEFNNIIITTITYTSTHIVSGTVHSFTHRRHCHGSSCAFSVAMFLRRSALVSYAPE